MRGTQHETVAARPAGVPSRGARSLNETNTKRPAAASLAAEPVEGQTAPNLKRRVRKAD